MTTAREPRDPRWTAALAHAEPWILGTMPVALLAQRWIPDPWALPFALACSLTIVATMTLSRRHQMRFLCPRCAANTPLDGPAEAARRARSLRGFHFVLDDHGAAYAYSWLGYVLLGMLAVFLSHSAWILFGLATFAYVCWAGEAVLRLRHRPLQPWCPECNWDDGGDEEEAPVPPPVRIGEL